MDHQRRVADKGEEFIRHGGKERFVGEEAVGEAVHPLRFDRHFPFRVQVEAQFVPGGEVIHQFDQADFHDAVTITGFEARGFGVENDLTHGKFSVEYPRESF